MSVMSDLAGRAQRLWPDDPAAQERWIKAVALVRSTRKGWLLDRPIPAPPPMPQSFLGEAPR